MINGIQDTEINNVYQGIKARELLRASLCGPFEYSITQVTLNDLEAAIQRGERADELAATVQELETGWADDAEAKQAIIDNQDARLDELEEELKEVTNEKIDLAIHMESQEDTIKALEKDLADARAEIARLKEGSDD